MLYSKSLFRAFICLISMVFNPEIIFAQLPPFTFETITVKEGLPSNTILSAAKDRDGFMWFGSRFCPIRYDGTTFQSYTDIETNFVEGIAADSDNNLWFSTDLAGVCRIEAYKKMIVPIEESKKMGQTGNFFIDSKGKGWYSDRFGVNQLDLKTKKIKHYPFRQTTYVWTKASFLETPDHTLWIVGKDNGLFKYQEKEDDIVPVLGADANVVPNIKDVVFSKGCVDGEGNIWMGSYNHGLVRYDPKTKSFKEYYPNRIGNMVRAVAKGVDENGKPIFWIGDDEGIGIFRPEQEQFYFFSDVLPESFEVNDIFRDPSEGIVWFCTSSGIIKYHPKSNLIQSINIPKNLVPFPVNVNVVLQDKTDSSGNTFFIGLSHNGLIKWNRKLNTFTMVPIEGTAEIRWMIQREDGTLWIGCNKWDYQRPGIFVYDIKRSEFLHNKLALLANTYFSVPFFMYGGFDQQGRLWIGNSDEGIVVLDEKHNKEVTPFNKETQKSLLNENNLINDFLIDSKGKIWLGNYNGVYLAEEQRGGFRNMDTKNKFEDLKDPAVNSLIEDHLGNIWSARWGGITRMGVNGKITLKLTTRDGFFDRESNGLVEDYGGRIWIGNYEGLYCYDSSNKKLIRFTVNDGLINNNTVDRIFKDLQGKEIFVGQKNGFNLIRVEQLLKASKPPVLAISSFKVHEKERLIDFSKPIQLERTDNSFSVDFAALNYRKQQDNQYSYYLEGLDEKWINSGPSHVVNYTNLSPGNYVLHLKAGDAFGNWNKKTLRMEINVLPAYYETLWFKILLAVLIAGFLYSLYRYRINQLLQMQKVRNRISADLHDELGSSLSGISIMGTLAKKVMPEKHPSTQFVEKIVEEVQQMSSSLDDIVWNISPKNDELTHLLARMRRYASEMLEAKQIAYVLTIPEGFHNIKLSMEQRRNFYMIFKEAINNLVKYSKCTNASVCIEINDKTLHLTIKDNGIGFDTSRLSDRNGLKNLRSRSEQLNGKIIIESVKGKGTEIDLRFPIRT